MNEWMWIQNNVSNCFTQFIRLFSTSFWPENLCNSKRLVKLWLPFSFPMTSCLWEFDETIKVPTATYIRNWDSASLSLVRMSGRTLAKIEKPTSSFLRAVRVVRFSRAVAKATWKVRYHLFTINQSPIAFKRFFLSLSLSAIV